MEKVSFATPFIIDLEKEAPFSAGGEAPVRTIQPVPRKDDIASRQGTDNWKTVYPLENPTYKCEHCPYSVTEKRLMDTHIKYPNYQCLKLQTMKEMKEWIALDSMKKKKKVKATPVDLDKGREEYWFCGDCIFKCTQLSQMEEHYLKHHPISTVQPTQSRPTLDERKEATGAEAEAELPAVPIPQQHFNKSVKRELSKSFVYAPHEQVDDATDSPKNPKKMKIVKPRQVMAPPKTSKSRAPRRPLPKKRKTTSLHPMGMDGVQPQASGDCAPQLDKTVVTAVPDPERYREESFYARVQTYSVGRRTVYLSCGDCIYTTNDRAILEEHVKRDHPSSTTALPQFHSSSKGKWREEWYYWDGGKSRVRFLFCDVCDFKTTSRENMEEHALCHPSSTTTHPR